MRSTLCGLAVVLLLVGCVKDDPVNSASDLEAYIAQVRANKMSESAKSTLGTVAGIHLGQLSVEYVRSGDGGMYWASYHSNSCPNPAATEAERQAQAADLESKRAVVMPAIVAAADSDSSGFVSTSEALRFRKIYEFGHEYAFVTEELAGDWSQFGSNSDMTGSDLSEWVKDYNMVAQRIAGSGVQLMVPIELPGNI